MTRYTVMVELEDPLELIEAATLDLAVTHPEQPVTLTHLGDGLVGVRVQVQAVSLVRAAETVTNLVETRLGGEPIACYAMSQAEFERRVPTPGSTKAHHVPLG